MARGGPVSVEFLFEGCDVIHKYKYEYLCYYIAIIIIRVLVGHIDLSEPSLPGRHKSRSTAVSSTKGLMDNPSLAFVAHYELAFYSSVLIRSYHHVLSLDFTDSADAVVWGAEIAVKATRILSIAIQFEFTEQKIDSCRIAPDEGGLSHSQTET